MYSYPTSPFTGFYTGTPTHYPAHVFTCIAPVVQHNLMELQAGASIPHVLTQAAAQAFLIGTGISPHKAIKIVEQWEAMGFFPVPGI